MSMCWSLLNLPRSIFALWMFHALPCRNEICHDLIQRNRSADWWSFYQTVLYDPLFRKVFYYRTHQYAPLATKLSKLLLRGFSAMELHADRIGGGMQIYHGYSTIVFAREIGENFTVYQQVTIGRGKSRQGNDIPIIGSNVTVYAGAIIVGGVRIGDHAVIGAGAVVTKDVPPNTTVVGAPVRYLEHGNTCQKG